MYWQVSFLLGTTVLSIWLKDIIPFFIRSKDIGPIHAIGVWVVMAVNYIPIYGGANSQLLFFEKTGQLWKRAFIAFAMNIILNVIFVPHFGIYAGAVNTFIAYMFLGYSSYFMKTYHDSKKMELNPMLWLIVTVGATGMCLVVVELNWLYRSLITAILLVGLLIFILRIIRLRLQSNWVKPNQVDN
jgi:O-antigen/teichoic acid export membrane protein